MLEISEQTGKGAAQKSAQQSYIYFIRAESGPIKIGRANNPVSRYFSLQTAHWEKLILLGCISGGPAQEREWHNRFEEARIRGEWFKPRKGLQGAVDVALKEAGVDRDVLYKIWRKPRRGKKYNPQELRGAFEKLAQHFDRDVLKGKPYNEVDVMFPRAKYKD